MLSRNKALTGKRTYGFGTRQAPNRGQVSAKGAQGYMRRELNGNNGMKRRRRPNHGADGKSDRRSGVAQKALNNNGGRPVMGQQGGQNHGLGISQGGGGLGAPPPQIKINDQGLLELPYNQDVASEQLGLLQGANEQLLGLKSEADQQGMEYTQGLRDSQRAYDQVRAATLNQNAAQGTAFSSKYGTAVANNATAFANTVGDLERQNSMFNQQQAIQRGSIQATLQQQLAALAQQYANDLGGQAGSLGFGKDKLPKKKPKKPKKPKQHKKPNPPRKPPPRDKPPISRNRRRAAGRVLKKQVKR